MDNRLKSAIATVLIQGVIGYGLVMGLAMSIKRQANDRLSLVDLPPERAPPPRIPPSVPPSAPLVGPQRYAVHDWSTASPLQRDLAFAKTFAWVRDNLSEEERRLIRWRAAVPQGSGPARVTRLRPPNLATHTLYWPASWPKGPLPIIAWGNGYECSNTSLPYAAFLSEIASHGYFVVAVGNDDIDYPQPAGLEILADGRPVHTQASALTRAVDWAIAENARAGSPYQGKLDTGRIAYMGHACGGQQAMAASSDPRTTTTVILNAAASFRPDPSEARRASIAQFEGGRDERGVIEAGDANFARAQAAGWPMYKATLEGMGRDGAFHDPDRRWTRAVIAWLDWQLKGDSHAAALLSGDRRPGWSRIGVTGL
jgi:dienelactone hydrolase